MIRLRTKSSLPALFAVLALLAGRQVSAADPTNEMPDFKEVYDLIRAHVAGLSEADLDRAAVRGLISALGPKVTLVTTNQIVPLAGEGMLVVKSNLFQTNIAYLRISRVGDNLAQAVQDSYRRLVGNQDMKGIVLDLRYAKGDDYAAAASTADLFIKKEQPLLDWGNGVVKSTAKPEVLASPIAVLVNEGTTGAAEALAAILRSSGVGLIIGSQTAGQAFVSRDYPLQNGERLRIATAPVQLGDGTPLSPGGVKPDLPVTVNAADERSYFANAYVTPDSTNLVAGAALSPTNSMSAANRPAHRVLFNEAELVRERREGVTFDEEAPSTAETDPAAPQVQDPALARALDLLMGLAVVRQSRT